MANIVTVTEIIRRLTECITVEAILLWALLLLYNSIQTSPTEFSELGLLGVFALPKETSTKSLSVKGHD